MVINVNRFFIGIDGSVVLQKLGGQYKGKNRKVVSEVLRIYFRSGKYWALGTIEPNDWPKLSVVSVFPSQLARF
ncbi:hypothetical protein GCM10028791_11900 [Echinicola sediminis]